jgi:hypothetical protein
MLQFILFHFRRSYLLAVWFAEGRQTGRPAGRGMR